MPSDSERKVIMTDEEMMEMVDLYRIAMLYRGTATTQLRREGRDMSQIYPVHLGERDKYHVVEYPQGYSGLIRPDGSEVTSLTEPEDIHWHRELKPIHDELNNLHQQLATITQERDALKRIIDDTLREVPVGNVNAHIPENLPMDMEYYVQETVKQDFEIERLEKERDALREENTRLRKYIGVMDAALKIPNGASTTAERCKRTNSLIGSDDWMEEPACPCVVCIDHVLTPSGEAGKGGGV